LLDEELGQRPSGRSARRSQPELTAVDLDAEVTTGSKRQKTSRRLTPKGRFPPPHPSSARSCFPHDAMDIDENRIDDAVLAPWLLGLHEGQRT